MQVYQAYHGRPGANLSQLSQPLQLAHTHLEKGLLVMVIVVTATIAISHIILSEMKLVSW